jgi:hypothetical protein
VLHNASDENFILHQDALRDAQGRFGTSAANIEAGKYEKAVFLAGVQSDFSKNPFMRFGPGMVLQQTREYPVIGVNLKDKTSFQFLFFTWPAIDTDQADSQRSRLASAGTLFTDPVQTDPAPLSIDPALLKTCDTTK